MLVVAVDKAIGTPVYVQHGRDTLLEEALLAVTVINEEKQMCIRLENGQIVERWGSTDELDILTQLGATPKPKGTLGKLADKLS